MRNSWSILVMLFLMISSSTNSSKSILHPEDYFVASLGGYATFTCTPSSSINVTGVGWLLDETPLNSSTKFIQTFDSNGVGTLRINNVSTELNSTRVQCIAIVNSSTIEQPSRNSTLYVQGVLSGVESLIAISDGDTIIFNWEAPFSLNYTLDDSSIHYCVDVMNSSSTLHSECGISLTEFSYSLPLESWCENYIFSVTPVNVVGNGTRRSIQFSQALLNPTVVSVTQLSSTEYTLTMSAPVCNAILYIEEANTTRIFSARGTNLNIAGASIDFTTSQLRTYHHYIIIVKASNIAGSSLSETSITIINGSDGNASTPPRTTDPTLSPYTCDSVEAIVVGFLFGVAVVVVVVMIVVLIGVLLMTGRAKSELHNLLRRDTVSYSLLGQENGHEMIMETYCSACKQKNTVQKTNDPDRYTQKHDVTEEMQINYYD